MERWSSRTHACLRGEAGLSSIPRRRSGERLAMPRRPAPGSGSRDVAPAAPTVLATVGAAGATSRDPEPGAASAVAPLLSAFWGLKIGLPRLEDTREFWNSMAPIAPRRPRGRPVRIRRAPLDRAPSLGRRRRSLRRDRRGRWAAPRSATTPRTRCCGDPGPGSRGRRRRHLLRRRCAGGRLSLRRQGGLRGARSR